MDVFPDTQLLHGGLSARLPCKSTEQMHCPGVNSAFFFFVSGFSGSIRVSALARDDEGAHVGCQSGLRPRDTPLVTCELILYSVPVPCTDTSPDSVKFDLGRRCDGGDLP